MFKHFDLRVVSPTFESPLTNLIIELDHLRRKRLFGSTKPIIFFQLKNIFHMLESLASARIEGNNTTIADYIETKIDKKVKSKEVEILEIQNMEDCLGFIDENIDKIKINRAFVSELHKIVVKDLPSEKFGEGDKTPGQYRTKAISIKGSNHEPPEHIMVPQYMDELFNFIESTHDSKYELLKTALAHHRFVWIHPFNNGNGRTVRMLTYAMLAKYGFKITLGRILNPAAVFCSDRQEYYDNLSVADSGTDKNLLRWCEYVLRGLKVEIEKIDNLLEYKFLKEKILSPALEIALERKWITEPEYKVLKRAIEKQVIKASDLGDIITSKHLPERSRAIRRLKDKKMLLSVAKNSRSYSICFQNNYLLRGVISKLYDEGFVPSN